MTGTVYGAPIKAHFLACFNEHEEILGDALKLEPPALISLQLAGDKMGFQLAMPREIVIPISRADIVGFAFFDADKQFLVGFSITGNPEGRKGTEEYVITSRYMIMAPKKKNGNH